MDRISSAQFQQHAVVDYVSQSVTKSPPSPELLLEIADRFGTPTYVYFERIISHKCDELRSHLSGIPLHLLYAVKANFNPAVLRVMLKCGLGVDAVSPGEVELALRAGAAPSDVLFSANNMTDEEMHGAQKRGVMLNIGDLSRLERFGKAYPGSDVCVRLNPQIGAGHHQHVITAGEKSKFGIPVEYSDRIRESAARYDLRIVGLHQHIGSGILDARHFWLAISVLLDAARGFPGIKFLNFGGGLGIPYGPDEKPIDFENFQRDIVEPLKRFLDEREDDVTFWFEPGRYLVAECGVLLVHVNTIKRNPTRTFAGTNSGFNHLARPTLYGSHHAIFNISNPEGPPLKYDVAGNICESGDMFARDRHIAEVREGDILAILDAGAYGMAMASEYNLRPLPAEVFVDARDRASLTRRRISAAELVDNLLNRASL